MTGMVAVIAHDRRRMVGDGEIDALATIYEGLRGPGRRHLARAGTYARVAKIDGPSAARPGIEYRDGDWVAATGMAYPHASLLGADLLALDGQFALIAYDRRADRVVVISDPFGMHALYMAERSGKTYISTSALTLARYLGAGTSRLGLSVFLRCGLQFGPITNWEGIERVEPATCLTFSADGRACTVYRQLAVDEHVARLRFPRAVDHAIDVLTELFRSRFAGGARLWADLTGGYDTRLLTLVLHRAGVDFRANTVGEPHNADVRIARRIARTAGWDWARFRVPEAWDALAPAMAQPALAWADGRLPAPQLAGVLWQHERKAHTHQTLLAGGGADVYRGFSWRQEFLDAGRSTIVNYDNLIRMNFFDIGDLAMLAAPETDGVYDYLRARMELRTRPYAALLNTTQLDVLLAYKRPNWDGIYGSAAMASLRFESPFFFTDAYQTAFSIWYGYRNHHRLMRAMIERLDPAVAAIPTTSGGPAERMRPGNLYRFAPYYAKIARAAATKLTLKALGRGLFAAAAVEDPRLVAGRGALARHLDLSPDTLLSASLYRAPALAAFLRRASSPDFAEGTLLERLITVEMIMRATAAPARAQRGA